MTTIIEKFKEIAVILKNAGIVDALKESEMLIMEALHISKAELYTKRIVISEENSKKIDLLALRRVKGEPIQYIIGYVVFYGLKMEVGRGVFIPRPETELLVDETIKIIRQLRDERNREIMRIIDLCTGSGCIAIALGKHLPFVEVYGVDISDIAIEYAINNAKKNGVNNVHFIKGDLFNIHDINKLNAPLTSHLSSKREERNSYSFEYPSLLSPDCSTFSFHSFDCIVSNPPYIKRADIPKLQREIRDYEPIYAIDGGKDGLDFYRKIFTEAPKFLKEKGVLILEVGINQSESLRELAKEREFKKVRFKKDFAGIERIFIGERK